MRALQKTIIKLIVPFVFMLIVVACQENNAIVDTSSTQKPEQRFDRNSLPAGHSRFEFRSDTMQRDFAFPLQVVVDNDYYKSNPVRRGDIVLIVLPEPIVKQNIANHNRNVPEPLIQAERKQLLRVVGLPGETIEIRNGQVYIDDRKLDAFYGREYTGGIQVEGNKAFQMSKALTIPSDQYFLLADQWSRSAYSSIWTTPYDRSLIQGKVVGYVD